MGKCKWGGSNEMRNNGLRLFVLMCLTAYGQLARGSTLDVCDLLNSADKYDGKIVTMRGSVKASYHWTLLSGKVCNGAIALADSASLTKDPLYRKYSAEVRAVRTAPSPTHLRVVLRGRFHSRTRIRGLTGMQLVIYKILAVETQDNQ
jgi:hypothetical protein